MHTKHVLSSKPYKATYRTKKEQGATQSRRSNEQNYNFVLTRLLFIRNFVRMNQVLLTVLFVCF